MKSIHYWERFAPASDITITQCGRAIPYEDSSIIVLWAEKEATCDDCIEISKLRESVLEG